MKIFKFKKLEHHRVIRFYGADISEEQIIDIFENTDMPEDEIDSFVDALLEGPSNPLFEDAYEIVCDSDVLDENWNWLEEDDWVTDRKGGYEVEVSFDGTDVEDETENE